MAYPVYLDYIASEADWLGQLPSHWKVRRLRFTANEPLKYGANEAADLEDVELPRYIRITDVKSDGSLNSDTFRSLDEEVAAPYLLEDGDILLARSGATVGKSFQYSVNWGRAAYAGYLIRFRPDQTTIHPRFAYYYFQTECYWACINSTLIQATIQNFSAEKYNDLKFPLPTTEEQKQIVDFLDYKTAQIDALIAKKKELIGKLKEERAAAINRTMMGRGIEYKPRLGEVHRPWEFNLPNSWRRIKLKYFTYMKGRLGWQNLKRDEYTDSGPCLVSSEHFADDRIQWDQVNHVSQERFEMAPEIILKVDDVLFMKDGAAMGKLAYVDSLPSEACLNSHLLLLRPDRNQVLPQFLYYALKSLAFTAYMIQERVGTTFFGFSEESMGNYPLSFPGVDEQRDILNYLNSETSRIDRMINKVELAIERLTDYRTALITAATTGKIDVRGIKLKGAK